MFKYVYGAGVPRGVGLTLQYRAGVLVFRNKDEILICDKPTFRFFHILHKVLYSYIGDSGKETECAV